MTVFSDFVTQGVTLEMRRCGNRRLEGHIRTAPFSLTSKAVRPGGFASKDSTMLAGYSSKATAARDSDTTHSNWHTHIHECRGGGGGGDKATMSDCNSTASHVTKGRGCGSTTIASHASSITREELREATRNTMRSSSSADSDLLFSTMSKRWSSSKATAS
jgi:hypothetical protein